MAHLEASLGSKNPSIDLTEDVETPDSSSSDALLGQIGPVALTEEDVRLSHALPQGFHNSPAEYGMKILTMYRVRTEEFDARQIK